MNLPFEYERVTLGEFGGTMPTSTDFDHARVVVLPVPLDRTTSYVAGTRNGPHEILVASSHMELWDEETGTDVHRIGGGGGGGEAPRPVGAPDRCPCRSSRQFHGHPAQSCMRDAPGARVRPGHAGRRPQPFAGGSRRRADAADGNFLRLQHARRS